MALSTRRASARCWKYDVFLSFRGEDTRKGFLSHLDHELNKWLRICTFIDDRALEGGTPISKELLSAIEDSHLAIVVFSPNYASSSWCLDELTKIVQCMEATDSVILPIFYDVDPSHVRKQLGTFAKAFAEHEKQFISTQGREKVKQWRADLTTVAGLSGWHRENYKSDRELIEVIVKSVWKKVKPTLKLFDLPDNFVGRDSALDQLSALLAEDENDVRFLGITGMGGIGKTTLAKLVFDSISHDFDVGRFLANVREVSAKDGNLVRLQKQLLSPILKDKVWDEQCGIIFTKKCLCNKKVLLVLDDVDRLKQLEVLAGNKDWFGNGSRIILTTRDEGLLLQHGITLSYKVEGLSDVAALRLFSLKAFGKDQPPEDFEELSEDFVKHARGVPLVLKTLGSSLRPRDRDAWNSALVNLQKIPNPEVFDSLKVSFDGLQEMEQRIFLDIACFHEGKYKQQVIDELNTSFGISSSIVIDILIEKCLLTFNKISLGCLEMHDLIQEMAWTIVFRESEEPGQRSRLWLLDDIVHVLAANTGTGAIEVIVLNLPELKEVPCSSEAFHNMHRLRLIEFDNVRISSTPKFLPYSLRIISWSGYPSKFLPQSFHPHFLTELTMRESQLVRLWDGRKDFPNLKYMDLRDSDKLTCTPDFTGIPNLEVLEFCGCTKLVHIHPSIAVLKRLKGLNFTDCKSIKSLPSELEMDSLKFLSLWGCSKVKKVPKFSEQMKTLSELDLGGTTIEQLPSSIENLLGLTELCLIGCIKLCVDWCTKLGKDPRTMDGSLVVKNKFKSLYSLGQGLLCLFGIRKSNPGREPRGLVSSPLNRLCCLKILNLNSCNLGEGAIPEDIGRLSSLEALLLGWNHFVTLPASIRCLSKLSYLVLHRCKSLGEFPHLPPSNRGLLLEVDVSYCTSLKRLTDPSKLSSKSANLYDFQLYPLNCIRLVEDEGWINYVLSRIVGWATDEGVQTTADEKFVFPGSEIPEWFSNKTYKNEELPPRECTNWLGIAFCLVFAKPEQTLGYPAAFPAFEIKCSFGMLASYVHWASKDGGLESEHVWVFYRPRVRCYEAETEFLFETSYSDPANPHGKVGVNMVKKWAARKVFKQDLEELKQRLKILKRTHEYYCEEAGPSGSAFFDEEQPIPKRQKQNQVAFD